MAQEGLKIPISADLSSFEKSLNNISKKLNSVGKSLTTKLSLPIAGILGLSVKAASDLSVTEKKVKTVFGNMEDSVWSWANESERALGMGAGTIASLTTNFADLVMGMGMTSEMALELGQSATETATILGNWNNTSAVEAMDDIQRAVTGSTKAVEKYGIKLTENVLNEQARAMGLGNTFNNLTEVEKAQVRYNAILNASGNAIKYWEEGNRSLNFSLNEIKEQVGNVMEVIGKTLLPVFENLAQKTADLMAKFAQFTAKNPEFVSALVSILLGLASIGPLMLGISKALKLFSKIGLLFSPVGLAIGGVTLAFTGLSYAIKNNIGGIGDKFKIFVDTVKSKLGDFVEKIKNAFTEAKKYFQEFGLTEAIAKFISEMAGIDYDSALKGVQTVITVFETAVEILVYTFEIVVNAFKGLMKVIKEVTTKIIENWGKITEAVKKPIEKIKEALEIILIPLFETVGIVVNELKSLFTDDFNYIKMTVESVVNAFKSLFENVWIPVWKVVGGVIGGVILFIIQVIKSIAPYISEFIVGIMGVINVIATVINGIATIIGGVINFIVNTFSLAWNSLKNICETVGGIIIGVIQVFAGAFTGDFETMKNGVILIWEKLKKGVSKAVDNLLKWLKSSFGELPSKMLQWGKDAIQGFVNGVKEKVSGAIQTVKDTASKIANGFKGVLKINSPSKLFRQYGAWTGEGFALGVEDSYNMASKSMRGLADIVSDDSLYTTFDNIENRINELGNMNLKATVTAEKVQRYTEFNVGARREEAVIENIITLDGNTLTRQLSPKFDIESGNRIKINGRRVGVK